jgi:hypothetical protein
MILGRNLLSSSGLFVDGLQHSHTLKRKGQISNLRWKPLSPRLPRKLKTARGPYTLSGDMGRRILDDMPLAMSWRAKSN